MTDKLKPCTNECGHSFTGESKLQCIWCGVGKWSVHRAQPTPTSHAGDVAKIDRNVLHVAREGFNTDGQADWLWYDHNAQPHAPVTFGRYAKHAGQVPFIRADIALKINETQLKDSQDAVDLAHLCLEICSKNAIIDMQDDETWVAKIKDKAYFEIYKSLASKFQRTTAEADLATSKQTLDKAKEVIAELVEAGGECREVLKSLRSVLKSARVPATKMYSAMESAREFMEGK